MTQQEISSVPGTDTTVVTERTGVQPDGCEHVQSRIVWPPSPLSGQSSETRYPEQPARVRADLDEAAKVQVTKGRHAKACKAVKDGTLTPPWYADVPPVGINDAVPVPMDPTQIPVHDPPFYAHLDPPSAGPYRISPELMEPARIPVTSEGPEVLAVQVADLVRAVCAAMAAGDVTRLQQVSAEADALLALLRHQDQALVLRRATHADLDRAMGLWSEEGR